MATRLVRPDPEDEPLSREEFHALMESEAKKLEHFARELREGKWERYNIQENFIRDGGPGQERATIVIQAASRLQAYGACRTGHDRRWREPTITGPSIFPPVEALTPEWLGMMGALAPRIG